MTEIQGKSILVRVSVRFELVRVRVIGSRLYSHIHCLNTKTRLTMLCLSGFELYSRWVPLSYFHNILEIDWLL